MNELLTVLVLTFLVMTWLFSAGITIQTLFIDRPRPVHLINLKFALFILFNAAYTLALPIVTVGYGVSLVLAKLFS